MFVLCSYRRSLGNKPEYYQPLAADGLIPGITKKRVEAKQFESRAEAALAIPGFQLLKCEQAKRIRARYQACFGENPFHQPDPILVEPVHLALM
jgi:hypothetical protein